MRSITPPPCRRDGRTKCPSRRPAPPRFCCRRSDRRPLRGPYRTSQPLPDVGDLRGLDDLGGGHRAAFRSASFRIVSRARATTAAASPYFARRLQDRLRCVKLFAAVAFSLRPECGNGFAVTSALGVTLLGDVVHGRTSGPRVNLTTVACPLTPGLNSNPLRTRSYPFSVGSAKLDFIIRPMARTAFLEPANSVATTDKAPPTSDVIRVFALTPCGAQRSLIGRRDRRRGVDHAAPAATSGALSLPLRMNLSKVRQCMADPRQKRLWPKLRKSGSLA